MAYLDMLLPICVALEWQSDSGGFDTSVVQMQNGRESRNQNRARPLSSYLIRYNNQTRAAWQDLDAFMHAAAGRANSWRLRDPRKNIAGAGEGMLAAIPGSADFQMVLRYTFGSYTFDKPVTKPASTVILSGAGSFSTSTGRVTGGLVSATWSGEFYLHARFDGDAITLSGVNRQANGDYIARYEDMPVVEVMDDD